MIPNVTRGGDMAGLVYYLAGPGRANEHTRPMIVAGDERITFRVEPGKELNKHDAFEIGYQLERPRRAHGTAVMTSVSEWDEEQQRHVKVGERAGHVWHCSLSLRADDRKVSASEWGTIAERFVEKMGFIDPDGAKTSRWVAIHHGTSKNGNDHIHVAVQLVREDGTKANTHNDFKRVQEACRELEKEFSLAVVEGRGAGKTLSGYKRAEQERARKAGDTLPVPVALRQKMRAALATAGSPLEYVQALEEAGVKVAPSFERGTRNVVRGYKVALPGESYTTKNGQYVFASPSKLDSSLSWPNICARFGDKGRTEAEAYLSALHGTMRRPGQPSRLQRPVHRVHVERMMSGKTGTAPDTLACIYARLAVQYEGGQDGPFSRMSERIARAQQSEPNGAWRVRQTARFAKGRDRGWLAVVRQANRLSRAMMQQHVVGVRPQLARDFMVLADASERAHKSLFPDPTTTGTTVPVGTREMQKEAGHGYGR